MYCRTFVLKVFHDHLSLSFCEKWKIHSLYERRSSMIIEVLIPKLFSEGGASALWTVFSIVWTVFIGLRLIYHLPLSQLKCFDLFTPTCIELQAVPAFWYSSFRFFVCKAALNSFFYHSAIASSSSIPFLFQLFYSEAVNPSDIKSSVMIPFVALYDSAAFKKTKNCTDLPKKIFLSELRAQ